LAAVGVAPCSARGTSTHRGGDAPTGEGAPPATPGADNASPAAAVRKSIAEARRRTADPWYRYRPSFLVKVAAAAVVVIAAAFIYLPSRSWRWSLAFGPKRINEPARRFQGHRGAVNAVAFRPDGKQLASGGADRMVRLWDVATGEVRSLAGHGHEVRS